MMHGSTCANRQTGAESSVSDCSPLLAAFEASPNCLLLIENGRIRFANRASVELMGYSNATALKDQPASSVLSSNGFCRTLSCTQGRCSHPACEQLVRRADGEEVRVEVECSSFLYEGREYVLIVLRESDRTALSRAIRDRELRFRAMFESAAIGISICSLDGRMLETNPAVTRMLGYTAEELAGMHPRELHPGDFEQDEVLIAELMRDAHESFELDKRYRRKDGTEFWGHVHVSTVRDAHGQPAFLIATLEDTTGRRRVEEQLREAEKMEVIGRLAGGVAHDFNNLLTGILLYCDLLSAGLHPGDRLRQHVDEIRMAGEQGAALTQQLLAIARKQIPEPRPTLLNEIVTSSENLIRRLVGEQIEFVTHLTPNLGPVLADQTQLRQVLLNLVLNARDAMPQGGRISVATRSGALSGNGRSAVVLSVEDSGSGMNEATRARLFEPFFTTKQPGRGTGLGLATVRRIVDEAGGAIDVHSELGSGTRIEVSFPEIARAVIASRPNARPSGGETVLLVDDHAGARRSLHGILLSAGYRIIEASSGQQALELFSEHASQVGLLVADCTMPDMTGIELARRLEQQKRDVKVLLISGYRSHQSDPTPSSVPLIHKPFSEKEILERIRAVLDSSGELPC